eukprot:scaffold40507_cov50-Prasinocladus_malaysianus.AAC.1
MAAAAERFFTIMSDGDCDAAGDRSDGAQGAPSSLVVSVKGLKAYLSSLSSLRTPPAQQTRQDHHQQAWTS